MTTTLGAKPVIDTSEYKARLKEMNADLRVLESGFRASTASMGDWAAIGTGLETRMKSLNAQMDVQRQKVALLKAVYEEIKEKKDADVLSTKHAEEEYNKAVASLGRMQAELTNVYESHQDLTKSQNESTQSTDNAAQSTENFSQSLDDARQSADDEGEAVEEASQKHVTFGEALKGVGVVAKGVVTAVVGLVAAVAAVAAAIGGLVFSSASAAGELVDLSAKTGISTTALQEMRFVGEQVGVSLETIATSQARLTRSMASAAEGTGDAAKAFKELGVSVTNTDGSLRDQQSVMADVLTALSGIDNAAERDALAMQIFGKSAMELNPLIGVTADELERMKDEAHRLGAVMSEEDILALESFDDTMSALKLGLQGTLGTLATVFLPGFEMVFGEIGGYLERFAGIVRNFGGTDNLIPGLTSLFADIAKDIAQSAPAMLEAGLGLIMGIIEAVKSALPNLLTSATDIINSLVNFLITALPVLLPMGIDILLTLVNAILPNLPLIIDAALQVIIALTNGLAAAAPQLVPVIVTVIGVILQAIWDNLPLLLMAGAQLLLGISQGLANSVPETTKQAITDFLTHLAFELIAQRDMLIESGRELIERLKFGLVSNLITLVGFGAEVATTIQSAIKSATKTISKAGSVIVEGLWAGITGQSGWLYQKIKEFIDDLIQKFLDAEGAKSPAKRFMPAGKFAVQGFVGGMFDEASKLEGQMNALMSGVHFSPAFAAANATASSNVVNNNGDTLTINGMTIPGDAKSLTMADIMDFLNKR